MPTSQELVDLLLSKYCYLTKDTNMLVLRSDYKYDFTVDKRKVALREHLIYVLETK